VDRLLDLAACIDTLLREEAAQLLAMAGCPIILEEACR
jgi:hypothetical protein